MSGRGFEFLEGGKHYAMPALKSRELQILRLLAQDLSAPAVAAKLGLTAETVRWYTKQLYKALDVNSRAAAIRCAMEHGLLDTAIAPSVAPAPVARSPVRFVEREGVSIAYQVVGDGPVDVLLIPGIFSQVDLWWELPEYAAYLERLGRAARVILFDKRGSGASDRDHGASTIEHTVNDACAVLDAVGSRRAFVYGTSDGGAASLLLASMRPERVRGLITFGVSACFRAHDIVVPWRERVMHPERARPSGSAWTDDFPLEVFLPSRAAVNRHRDWWPRFLRASSGPSLVVQQIRANLDIDLRALAPSITTRTLLLHRAGDRVVPVSAAHALAGGLPNAQLVVLSGADHAFFVDDDGAMSDAVLDFLARPEASDAVRTFIGIVLAGHGGPPSGEVEALLQAHAPRAVRAHDGGWCAVFDAPSHALRCARALRALGRGRVSGLALHVGGCALADGAPVGSTGAVAYDAAARAKAGEVLVTSTLRDILAGMDAGMRAHGVSEGASTVWLLDA